MSAVSAHPRPVQQYLDALRAELQVQLRAADVDRVIEEVAGHLNEAIDHANAGTDEEIAAVLGRFGSPAEVGLAYRKSNVRAIENHSPAGGPRAGGIPTGTRQPVPLPAPTSWI